MIEVSGDNMIGVTTLKITARADGYETETVIVTVEALSRLRIEAPVTFDLTERESTQISVRLTRIEAGIDTVILEIAPEEGSGLTVDPSSLTFMDTQPQTVTVIATNDDLLTGDRSGILTLTATTGSYAVETVTIMILDNPSVVGVTTLENQASTTISEADGTVTLQLNINPPFDSPSQVNILYSGDPGALTGVSSSATVDDIETDEMVPVGVTEHIFNVSVMNDDIAEFIRQVDVSVASGPAYQAASSSVKITVEDDDVATVSISPVNSTVTEGDTIIFEVTQDGATDQPSSISLTLTHNGDFFSPRMDTLNLTSDEGTNLNLTGRHKRNGKLYYYLDFNSNSDPDDNDRITHNLLDRLLNKGDDTVNTQPDGHIGSDDATFGDY